MKKKELTGVRGTIKEIAISRSSALLRITTDKGAIIDADMSSAQAYNLGMHAGMTIRADMYKSHIVDIKAA